MSRDDDALGGPYYAPTLLAKRKKLIRDLDAKVAAGDMTQAAANAELSTFTSMIFAHHREHGSEPKP